MLLFAGGLTVFLIGIGFGGNPYQWTSAAVLCPIILGGLCVFVAFPLWEIYSPDTIVKVCPPHLFRSVRTVVIPYGVTFVAGMALISLGTLWPQQIARLFTTVPSTVGWYALANQGCATGMIGSQYVLQQADLNSWIRGIRADLRNSSANKMAVYIRGHHDGTLPRTQRYRQSTYACASCRICRHCLCHGWCDELHWDSDRATRRKR